MHVCTQSHAHQRATDTRMDDLVNNLEKNTLHRCENQDTLHRLHTHVHISMQHTHMNTCLKLDLSTQRHKKCTDSALSM